jgi:hypothetical protein
MYRFNDEISDKIVDEYEIEIIKVFYEESEKMKIGIEKLASRTCEILDNLNNLDDSNIILIFESLKFFIDCYRFQKNYNEVYENYYKIVLNKFHELGYLHFKKNIKSYKIYKNKKWIYKINYLFETEPVCLTYYSHKNLMIDFGRYRCEKITSLFPKNTILNYEFIEQLS